MSLLVVSVVVSIGLVVIDLTLKQLRLSTNSKDSETAFHAANAAMECARYWRNHSSTTFDVGGNVDEVECFGETIALNDPTSIAVVDQGIARKYSFEGTWGIPPAPGIPSTQRCSQVDILVVNSNIDAITTINVLDMQAAIPGYPSNIKECASGGLCTVIAARGYSRACNQLDQAGTVQREVLLEL